MLFLAALLVPVAPLAQAQTVPPAAPHESAAPQDAAMPGAAPADPVVWHTTNYFSTCDGNCSVSIFGGSFVTTAMTSIFIRHPDVPSNWHWGNSNILGGVFSRRLVTLWGVIDVEPEIAISQRFGSLDATEAWAAAFFRWTWFPWNDYVRTTIGLPIGLSVTSKVDTLERHQNRNPHGSILLNYFSPEITFALPQYPQGELFFRFHHRSGIFGIFNDVYAGSQYGTVGLRYRF